MSAFPARQSSGPYNPNLFERLTRLYKRLLTKLPEIIVSISVLAVFWILILRFVPAPGTYLMVKRWFQSENRNIQYDWVNFNDISTGLKVCAMASEDQNLPFHYGMDLEAISKAVDSNAKGKRLRGASTISQQVAKNVFLWPDRSYVRKIFEIFFTWGIEVIWKKERILEMYLNVAETGDGIYGVQAAAQFFFNKDASKLTVAESAAIIAVLPSPLKYNIKNPGTFVAGRRDKIVRLYNTLDGPFYLRELYVRGGQSMYDFKNYKD